MSGMKHAFTHASYELTSDGNIQVTDGDRQGLFTHDGRWISGEMREADPQMCVWVSNVPGANTDSDSHLSQ